MRRTYNSAFQRNVSQWPTVQQQLMRTRNCCLTTNHDYAQSLCLLPWPRIDVLKTGWEDPRTFWRLIARIFGYFLLTHPTSEERAIIHSYTFNGSCTWSTVVEYDNSTAVTLVFKTPATNATTTPGGRYERVTWRRAVTNKLKLCCMRMLKTCLVVTRLLTSRYDFFAYVLQ